MFRRFLYTLCGLLLGALVNIAINLLSSAIQQNNVQLLSEQALWGLAAFTVIGLLLGYWLGEQLKIPVSSTSAAPLLRFLPLGRPVPLRLPGFVPFFLTENSKVDQRSLGKSLRGYSPLRLPLDGTSSVPQTEIFASPLAMIEEDLFHKRNSY